MTALIRCHAERFGFTGYHYYITRDGQTYQTRHEQQIGAHPDACILGYLDLPNVHCSVTKETLGSSKKACPCFDARTEYSNL